VDLDLLGREAFFLVVVVVTFVAIWMVLSKVHRRRLKKGPNPGEVFELNQLEKLKNKLTDEEFKRIRQTLVEKIALESEKGIKILKKEIDLTDLNANLNQSCKAQQERVD